MNQKPRPVKEILLGLMKDLRENCDKASKKKKVKRDEFSLGYLAGQEVLLNKLEKLIQENL